MVIPTFDAVAHQRKAAAATGTGKVGQSGDKQAGQGLQVHGTFLPGKQGKIGKEPHFCAVLFVAGAIDGT